MSQEEILEYNKKCAKFLKLNIDEYWVKFEKDMPSSIRMTYSKTHHIEQLQFHSDWNWIMELVEAIEKLENTEFFMEWFCLNGSNIGLYKRHKQNGSTLWEYIARFSNIKTKKEAMVEAINQFLNQQ